MKVEMICRWTLSADCNIWSLYETVVFCEYGELLVLRVLEEMRRLQGGLIACSSGEGEPIGDIGRARAFAVEL